MNKTGLFLVIMMILFGVIGWGMNIVATINPYYLILDQLAGDLVDVHLLIGQGQNPHIFSPTIQDVRKLNQADWIIANGYGLESFLIKTLHDLELQGKKITYAGELIPEAKLKSGDHHSVEHHHHHHHDDHHDDHHDCDHHHDDHHDCDHHHDDHHECNCSEKHHHDDHHDCDEHHDCDHHHDDHHDCDHDHGPINPHVWVEPIFMAEYVVPGLAKELAWMLPQHASLIMERAKGIVEELESFSKRAHAFFDPYQGSTIVMSHPSFTYFFRRFGIAEAAVFSGEATEPTIEDIRRIIQTVREEKVLAIFGEVHISPRSLEVIVQETGLKTPLRLNTLGWGTQTIIELFESNFQTMKQQIQ